MNAETQDAAFLRDLSVLYVDDDSIVREGITLFLGRRVAQVETARDGAEGLAAFKARKPALVLTDIRMPGMDGLTMIQEIRALDPEVPIIVTTAFEQTDYMARAIELRVDRYVVKPVDPDRLEAALLDCARLLRAEVELAEKHCLEIEVERLRHDSAQRILASGLAHDYNNLLQAILATGEAASKTVPAGSPAHIFLGTMQRYIGTASRLGQQLLTLSQNVAFPRESGSLVELMTEVVNEACSTERVHVDLHFQDGFPPILFNREQIKQAMGVLLVNAEEAMPQGGTTLVNVSPHVVTQASQEGLAAGTYVRISIQDSGAGISPENLPHIFEPYFSTKPIGRIKGQGLGLALCRSIVLMHGGQIIAESEVGHGSTFHVYLPVDGS